MRALPPPRRSRARRIRKLLHQIYIILSLQWIIRRRSQITIKRRRTPFHLSNRKYKVKVPKQDRPTRSRKFRWFKIRRRVVATQILNSVQPEELVVNRSGF